jgi:transcriptional regulator with XRE-family HTH domain
MTGAGLKRMLDRAGLSQRGLAKELQINERTMRRYCSGEQPIPKTVEYAILWVYHQNVGKEDGK